MLVVMAVRTLDLQVLHRGRNQDVFQASGEPADAAWLASQLRGWLELNRWKPARWDEFELVAFETKTWKRLARVRA